MAIQKTEAFVLKTQPFRSSSLIVTLFSRSFGKLRGLVKGVRREGEVRGALFELFSHLEILFYEKLRSDLHLISEASLLSSHDVLRTRLETIAAASFFCELVDALTEVHDPHPKIFELLDFSFRHLPSVPPAPLAHLFEIQLVREIGWLPYLESCLSCRRPVPEKGFFSIKQGAVICERCASSVPDARPLTSGALGVMRYFVGHGLEESVRLRVSASTTLELEGLLQRFLLLHLGRPLRSQEFMKALAPVLTTPTQ